MAASHSANGHGKVRHYAVTDMHTAGEPVRIFTGGLPLLAGDSLLAQRRNALDRHDSVRRLLMREPRGHADMYGVWPLRPHHPDAAMAVLFTHNGGYSTMCGHATIALGRWMVDQQFVTVTTPETRFVLECPCGPVAVRVAVDEAGSAGVVSFDSVPAFAAHMDAVVDVPGIGAVPLDVAYGGAFYAILPASRVSLDLAASPFERLVEVGRRITAAGREALTIRHPSVPDLGFLYGTILTDDVSPGAGRPSYNVCVFGDGQVDRSATGSGVTARVALDRARGLLDVDQPREFRGLSDVPFVATLTAEEDAGCIVSVSGRAHYAGRAEFVVEADDPLSEGLTIPDHLGTLWTAGHP